MKAQLLDALQGPVEVLTVLYRWISPPGRWGYLAASVMMIAALRQSCPLTETSWLRELDSASLEVFGILFFAAAFTVAQANMSAPKGAR